MQYPILFQWGVSTLFGWGVIGLQMLRHWQAVAGTKVYCGGQMQIDSLAGLDPLTLRALTPVLIENSELRSRWPAMIAATGRFDGVVLQSMGNRCAGLTPPSAGGLGGRVTGVSGVIEDTILPDLQTRLAEFAFVATGSTWMTEILQAQGIGKAHTVIQGIDPAVFHPAPRSGALEGRFVVFSGGKLEYRKAQDLVLLAFRAFAQRHPEAVLVTAWHSPWPAVALQLNSNRALEPIGLDAEGKVDVARWVSANGIAADQFIDVGTIPNHLMARVLREADVAIFPNRCEGGTNLVAMECMACGVPAIVADNTGQRDLVRTGAPYVLGRQRPISVPGLGTEGWGESDVEELVEALEQVWTDRAEAARRGAAGAQAMQGWSWRAHVETLRDTILPYCV